MNVFYIYNPHIYKLKYMTIYPQNIPKNSHAIENISLISQLRK